MQLFYLNLTKKKFYLFNLVKMSTTTNIINNQINANSSPPPLSNQNAIISSNESKNLNSKKKEQPLQETFLNLCHSLLRFIDRKIVKKYIYPNAAQLPKEKRNKELKIKNEWKYYLNEEISEEEKIKDVFKDNKFLNLLQNLAVGLNEVIEYLELNQKNIKMIEEKHKNKEEKLNTLNELKDLLVNFFEKNDKNSEENNNDNNKDDKGKSLDNILEKINLFNSLQKNNIELNNIEKNEKNEKNIINIFNVKNEENVTNSEKSAKSEKKEVDLLINNFRLDKNEAENDNENNVNLKEKEEINSNNINNININANVFLNKKTERENLIKENINNIINNPNAKNKKKKTKNKEKIEIPDKLNIKNINNPSIKLENIPLLKSKEEKIIENKISPKKVDDIDDDIINKLLESEDSEKSEQNPPQKSILNSLIKPILNASTLPKINIKEKDAEEIFDELLTQRFKEKKDKNKSNNFIQSIVSLLNDKRILGIEKYNERISGPYLAGSYKTFQDLCFLEYNKEIDIIYKYKNMLLNDEVKDFSIKEVLETYLELNIVKKIEKGEDENKVDKVWVECVNKKFGINICFNILFVDIGYQFNDKIIDELILNKKEFLSKPGENKFRDTCLFMRLWRRKNEIFYLIPEILDEFVLKYLTQDKTKGNIVLNVFYDLYNGITDLSKENNNFSGVIISNKKNLCQDILSNFFIKDNEDKMNDLKKKILKLTYNLKEKNFDEMF